MAFVTPGRPPQGSVDSKNAAVTKGGSDVAVAMVVTDFFVTSKEQVERTIANNSLLHGFIVWGAVIATLFFAKVLYTTIKKYFY